MMGHFFFVMQNYSFYTFSQCHHVQRIRFHTMNSIFAYNKKISFISTYFPFNIHFQISTATGIMSHFVNLQVVVPEAFILGSGELHVDMGSAINLVCIIEKVSQIHSNKKQFYVC